jgi:hypothetical protein
MQSQLNSSIAKILEVTSQHELEIELVLPLYLLYHRTHETSEYLKSVGLFTKFIDKWLKYLPLFRGDMLKRVSLLTLMRIPDPGVKHTIRHYIT